MRDIKDKIIKKQINWCAVGLVSFGVVLLSFSLSKNIGATNDSVLYFQGGKYLSNNGIKDLYSQFIFIRKPPLYSIIISIFGCSNFGVKIFNVLCYIGTMWATWRIIKYNIKSDFLRLTLFTQLSLSATIFLVHNYLWTEPLFILLLTFYILIHIKLVNNDLRHLHLLPSIGLLMVLLKHVGVIFPIISTFFLIYYFKVKGMKLFNRTIFFNAFVPVSFFTIWHFMVYLQANTLQQFQQIGIDNLLSNLEQLFVTIKSWFIPGQDGTFLFSLSLWLVNIFWIFLISFFLTSKEKPLHAYFVGLVLSAYFFVLLGKEGLVKSDSERYLAVVIIPFFVLVFSGLEKLRKSNVIKMLTFNSIIILWTILSIVRSLKNIWIWSGGH